MERLSDLGVMFQKQNISFAIAMSKVQEETIIKEQGRLLNFIRSKVSNLEDAEDILQDVLFQFVNGYNTIESIEKTTSWLFSVARNKIIDLYRKRKVRSGQVSLDKQIEDQDGPLSLISILPDTGNSPEDLYFKELVWEAINNALDELPKEQRDVFVAHEFEDKSFKQISAETGVTVNTLISRKRYAILAMRNILVDLYNDI